MALLGKRFLGGGLASGEAGAPAFEVFQCQGGGAAFVGGEVDSDGGFLVGEGEAVDAGMVGRGKGGGGAGEVGGLAIGLRDGALGVGVDGFCEGDRVVNGILGLNDGFASAAEQAVQEGDEFCGEGELAVGGVPAGGGEEEP